MCLDVRFVDGVCIRGHYKDQLSAVAENELPSNMLGFSLISALAMTRVPYQILQQLPLI